MSSAKLKSNSCKSSGKDEKIFLSIVFKTFSGKFNETYSEGLLSEQKELLNRYILSFDSDTDIKVYLNEELARLHTALKAALSSQDIKTDQSMIESTNSVIKIIEEFRSQPVDKNLIEKVLKIQNLVHEISV